MIIGLIWFGAWWFGLGAFYLYLADEYEDDPVVDRQALQLTAALWPFGLFAYLAGVKSPPSGVAGKSLRTTLLIIRLALIVGALASMAVIWRDLAPRLNIPPRRVALAPRRIVVDEPALEQWAIEGPAVVSDYYHAGYAWAQAHGQGSAQCPQDNRAYRDGCRAFFASRHGRRDDGREPAS